MDRKVRTVLQALLYMAVISQPLSALDPHKRITQYDIRIYKAKDGLPMNSLKKIFQDSKGYIWLGTQEGLVRFDGVQFKLYDKSRYPGLKSNFIWDIAEDKEGNLWLATNGGGVSRFDGQSFASYDTADGLSHNIVRKVAADINGTLWFGTEKGVCCLSQGGIRPGIKSKMPYISSIQALLAAQNGDIYFGGQNAYWAILQKGSLFEKQLHFDPTAIYESKAGGIIIGGSYSQIFYYKDRQLQKMSKTENSFSHEQDYFIRSLFEDKDGVLWLCTEGLGIIRFYAGRFDTLSIKSKMKFDNNFFVTGMEDAEGSLWFGGESGLIQIKENKFLTFGTEEDLISNYAITISSDKSGETIVGFRDNGLSIIGNNGIKSFGHLQSIPNQEVLAVLPNVQGGWWVSLKKYGLIKFVDHKLIDPVFKRTYESVIYSLCNNGHNELWIGSSHGIISQVAGNTLKEYPFSDRTYEYNDVISIIATQKRHIWFGTRGDGLYKLIDEKITRDGIPATLLTDGINAFHQDSSGVIYIGTDNNGLFRYINGAYENFSGKDGLFSDRIFAILEDDSLNLWCSTNKGIFSISKHQLDDFAAHHIDRLTCKIYNHLDGMREAECNGRRQPVACKDRDGKLWFVGIAGAVCVDPNHMPMNNVKPPVYIEEIKGADSTYRNLAAPLRLKNIDRDVQVKYTALSFTIPERVRFKYRLQGHDPDWVEAGARRTAYYTNLKKGDYHFQVIACNNDNVWNSEGASIAFTIPPYWYETWWAYVGYIIAGAALARVVVRKRYQRSLMSAQLKMEKEHAARLEELDAAKSRFFAGISHEFRTPLTLIKGPLKEMLDHATSAPKRTLLTIMYNNTRRLERLVQELLDLAHLQSHSLQLELMPVDIISFVKTIMASFESLARQRRIELALTATKPGKKLIVLIDPDKIDKVLLNLLSNAFKYTSENDKISVSIDYVAESGHLLIKISDTGRGIPPDIQPKIFDLFFRYQHKTNSFQPGAGIGLALSQELVKLHDGEITVTSAEGVGSTFTIRLPVKTASAAAAPLPSGAPAGEPVQNMAVSNWYDESLTVNGNSKPARNKKGAQILLVEDNPELRYFIKRHLKHHYAVWEATDGEMALQLLAKFIPDLIVSDIMMPRMDGLEFIKRVKLDQTFSHIPVILVTARGSVDNKMEGLESGAVEYLTKPFEIKELLLKVNNLLDLSQKLRERYRKLLASTAPEPASAPVISLDDRFLQKAYAIVLEHLPDAEFGADNLAQQMAISRPHLNRKLFALTGLRTNEFIRTLRLKRAAELLQAKAGSVSEIAFQAGFEHLSYFAKSFKSQYGVLPSEYGE